MQTPYCRRRLMFGLLAGAGGLLVATGASAADEPIAVVMSSRSGQRGLSSDKLRRVFLATPTDDDDGNRFIPLNLTRGFSIRERFDQSVLQMSPDEVGRYWIDQRLRGNKPPRSAGSLDLLKRVVQELRGAIAYVPLSAVGSLHVVVIDGRKPGESGYPIR